jgi:hypothetical protein
MDWEYLVARVQLCMCYTIILAPTLWISWKVLLSFNVMVKMIHVWLARANKGRREFEEKYDSGYFFDDD